MLAGCKSHSVLRHSKAQGAANEAVLTILVPGSTYKRSHLIVNLETKDYIVEHRCGKQISKGIQKEYFVMTMNFKYLPIESNLLKDNPFLPIH